MRALVALGLTLALVIPLGGCGAIIAGTAGGLAAGAVLQNGGYDGPPPPYYRRHRRPGGW
jgi:hypothetical protein